MTLLQNLLGNIAELAPDKAQQELLPILIPDERVEKAFKLFRHLIVLTDLRIITLDKEGVTGSKQTVTSIPYHQVKRFSRQSAGLFDLDAELCLWLRDEAEPIRWEFSKGVDINEVYHVLSRHVLAKNS